MFSFAKENPPNCLPEWLCPRAPPTSSAPEFLWLPNLVNVWHRQCSGFGPFSHVCWCLVAVLRCTTGTSSYVCSRAVCVSSVTRYFSSRFNSPATGCHLHSPPSIFTHQRVEGVLTCTRSSPGPVWGAEVNISITHQAIAKRKCPLSSLGGSGQDQECGVKH